LNDNRLPRALYCFSLIWERHSKFIITVHIGPYFRISSSWRHFILLLKKPMFQTALGTVTTRGVGLLL
jgi:hypothetical protein